jgi:putative oxidoreductase
VTGLPAFQEPLTSWVVLLARLCLASVFMVSALHKAIYYHKAEAEFAQAHVPLIAITLPSVIALHLFASLAIILGVFWREAAILLAAFTVIATVKVHGFWAMQGEERLNRSRVAMAHLAVTGGLLLLAALGPGQFTLL